MRPYLQLVIRIGSVLKQQLNDSQVTPGTSQGEGRVVVVGGRPVDVGTLRYQELDRAEVTGTRSLHEGRAPSFRLVLLFEKGNAIKTCSDLFTLS
jgi:hypothetical protein